MATVRNGFMRGRQPLRRRGAARESFIADVCEWRIGGLSSWAVGQLVQIYNKVHKSRHVTCRFAAIGLYKKFHRKWARSVCNKITCGCKSWFLNRILHQMLEPQIVPSPSDDLSFGQTFWGCSLNNCCSRALNIPLVEPKQEHVI